MMKDFEICKRIAEIEGLCVASPAEAEARGYLPTVCCITPNGKYLGGSNSYNPLTDKAMCFDLMVKYKVTITFDEYCVIAEILLKKEDGDYSFYSQTYCPQRAICLAIIEAHEV